MKSEILFVAIGYLLGSLPFSLIMGFLLGGKDIRREGSGNVGATNVFRVAGKRAGLAAAAGDIGKSLLPVLTARVAGLDPSWVAATGFATIVGHCYPVWLRFRGGKGVNSALAVFTVLSLPSALVFGVVWLLLFRLTRWVSLASIAGAATFPLTLLLTSADGSYTVMALATALFILYRHRSNVRRILEGTESRMERQGEGTRNSRP